MRPSSNAKFRSVNVAALAVIICAVFVQGCNLHEAVYNRSATTLGSHRMTISPAGGHFSGEKHAATTYENGVAVHTFSAGETEVVIKNEVLSVNGKSYGALKEGDAIDIRNGKVLVNSKEVQPGQQQQQQGTVASN